MTRARIHINISFLLAVIALLSPSFLLSSCSSGDDGMNEPTPQGKQQEIRFNPGVWNFMEGTRAAFYDTGAPLTSSFTCTVYNASTTTPYVNQTTVNYIADQWTFENGKHYWPATGSLDFFAYMPKADNLPSYIKATPTYTTDRNPQFTCEGLPMTYNRASPTEGQGSGLQEFVYALVTGQNKAGQGASGVTLNFQHPFTRINLQLSANHPDITINTITFKSLKNNGTCSFNGTTSTWTPSGDATNFVVTLNQTITQTNAVQVLGVPFIMIPQDWAGEIVVDADCLFWGDKVNYPSLTTTVPTTWLPGYSYTYTFNISPDDLKVNILKFTEQW